MFLLNCTAENFRPVEVLVFDSEFRQCTLLSAPCEQHEIAAGRFEDGIPCPVGLSQGPKVSQTSTTWQAER